MSSPSTPRSAHSPFTTSEGPDNGISTDILTPSRKIRALLAAFDSESESDRDNKSSRKQIPRPDLDRPATNFDASISEERANRNTTQLDEDDEDDGDDIPVAPKGRLAARMAAESTSDAEPELEGTAYDRVSKKLRRSAEHSGSEQGSSAEVSPDMKPTTGRRKRLLKSKRRGSDVDNHTQQGKSRSQSPLFVSPGPSRQSTPNESDPEASEYDKPSDDQSSNRFLALVAKKRQEREEKERVEAEKKAKRAEMAAQFSSQISTDEESDDNDAGRRLTQQSRPARKASKKALEEMNRETQRMSRNMQLAHQAQTKKKITKESFFARFNFQQPQDSAQINNASSTTNSSLPGSSDGEGAKDLGTPPTSPPRMPTDDAEKGMTGVSTNGESMHTVTANAETQTISHAEGHGENPLTVNSVAIPQESGLETKMASTLIEPTDMKTSSKPPVRVRVSRQEVAQHQQEDSDSDLEVVTSPAKCRRIAAFENLPVRKAQESASLLKLRTLAQLTSPGRKKSTMSPAELQASLRQLARQQAAKERREKIEELKAKGIYIDTAAENAKMEEDVENLLEKARKEAEEILQKEKAAAKKSGEKQEPAFVDDSDADGDYEGSEQEIVYSGSEEEDEESGDDEQQDDDQNMIDQEADEAEDSEGDGTEGEEPEQEPVNTNLVPRRKKVFRVISDDEDDDDTVPAPTATFQTPKRPELPKLQPEAGGSTMSLSQAFAATLGESQEDTQQDSLTMLRQLPDPGLPVSELLEIDSQEVIKDSQENANAEPIDLLAGYTQGESRVSESPAGRAFSEFSQVPEPTQDAGFIMSPFDQRKRFLEAPVSTVDTIALDHDSPIKRKGRLRRGAFRDDIDDDEDNFEVKASAFDILRKGAKNAKKTAEIFDRNTSKAKEVIDEAAEESEDEYAGLGGASDDSAGEEDDLDRAMINDTSGEAVDERKLASFHANKERANDEKEVSKLLKDITTGGLRRKRGAADDFDLDDSDDEMMARRRVKRKEFAKMRKALLADEKIGQIADNPKNAAFIRSIEDRGVDFDMDLDFLEEDKADSQDTSEQEMRDTRAEISADQNKRKRPLEPSAADMTNRAPPNMRRTAPSVTSKKPMTLAEIRESVSFLLEGPENSGSDSFNEPESGEDETSDDELALDTPADPTAETERPTIMTGINPRRTRGKVVDRLALLRAASSNSASSNGTNMAFQANSNSSANTWGHPPPLLRRITSNFSTKSTSSTSASSTSSASAAAKKTVIGPGAGARGSKGAVNSYTAAREKERERELRLQERGSTRMSKEAMRRLEGRKNGGTTGGLFNAGQWE